MKKLAIFTVLFLLGLMLVVWGDNFRQYTIYHNVSVAWNDAEDNYVHADSAAFDGSGLNDMGVTKEVEFGGAVDSVVLVEILKGNHSYNDTAATGFDGDSTDDATIRGDYVGTLDSVWVVEIMDEGGAGVADTIRWGGLADHDTTSVVFTDTAVMADATDSSEIGSGVYVVFTDSVGHKTGDRWVLKGYGYWADSIRHGIAAGHDTASWSIWNDTVAIDADSNAMTTGEVYVVFDSLASHTIGDRWVVKCYAEDAEILYSVNKNNDTLPIRIDAPKIYLYYRALAAAASDSTDSIIFRAYSQPAPYRAFYQVWGDTIACADTAAGAPRILDDSNSVIIYIDSLHFGALWKTEWEVRGEEQDTNTYDLLTVIRGLNE